jgi:hypothetical protein
MDGTVFSSGIHIDVFSKNVILPSINLFSKTMNIKIYKTIILLVALCDILF